MTDNFDLIKNFIKKNYTLEKGDFFFIQVLKRRKENPELKKDVSLIDTFFINDSFDLEDYRQEIIKLCHDNNARCYIRLDKRNSDKICLQALKITTDDMINSIHDKYTDPFNVYCILNNIKKDLLSETEEKFLILRMVSDILLSGDWYNPVVKYQFLSAAGQFASDPIRKWIIDLDDKTMLDEVRGFLETLTNVLEVIPTKNGYHIITTGFNPNLFTKKYSNIEIKRNSPTILYSI